MNMINFVVVIMQYNNNLNNNEINRLNVKLIDELNKTGKIYLSHTMINDIYSIRMPIGSTSVNIDNIKSSWKLIKKVSQDII